MKRGLRFLILLSIGVLITTTPVAADSAHQDKPSHHVCGNPSKGLVRCEAIVIDNGKGKAAATTSPTTTGYGPSDLRNAYRQTGTSTQTVAIVDAYDNPNAESDLAAYRSQYGLTACTTANGCFKKVDEHGNTITSTSHPAANTGWGQEIDLDIEMVSAICATCNITLVEANASSYADLGTAEDTAAASGANAISNSYGGSGFSAETSAAYNGHFNHPGVAITASAGDAGYGVEFPAASQYVTAVGGTSLNYNRSTNTRVSESAWSGTGSGCSAYVSRPRWQTAIGTCTHREVADVSADADPNTGVAVYDSFGSTAGANWYVFGGTSVASPIIASIYAQAGNASSINYGSFPYSHTSSLFDITSGSNGRCTTNRSTANKRLCTASTGWDGPTGVGTPNGTGAF